MTNAAIDLGEWLRSIGLGQYDKAFRENGIDADILPDLTEADLEKLGILLGHRKRLLKSIANLGPVTKAAVATSVATSGQMADAAERRQVTVLFSDLVGSTALSSGWTRRTCARSSLAIKNA